MATGTYKPGELTRLWRERLPRIQRSAVAYAVSVGVHEDASDDVRTRAVAHEFGTKTIPARPFISLSTGDQPKTYSSGLREMAHEANLEGVRKGGSVKREADELAREATDTIQGVIDSSVPPVLQAATIAEKTRKGYRSPRTSLVATGEMRDNSIGRVITKTQVPSS